MAYYFIEVTDTHRTWVEKYCIEANETTAIRRAKTEIGWNGMRCDRKDCGDLIELRPRGLDQRATIQREPD